MYMLPVTWLFKRRRWGKSWWPGGGVCGARWQHQGANSWMIPRRCGAWRNMLGVGWLLKTTTKNHSSGWNETMSPLLHCEIGVRNIMFELLQDIINEHIEIYAPGEELIRVAVTALKNKSSLSPQNKGMSGMIHSTGSHEKRWNSAQLPPTRSIRGWLLLPKRTSKKLLRCSTWLSYAPFRSIVNKLRKAHCTLANQQTKLKEVNVKNKCKTAGEYWDKSI